MAEDSTRRPRDEPLPSGDGQASQQGSAASDGAGETLAEKIRRYRHPRPSGGAPGPASEIVRHPREE